MVNQERNDKGLRELVQAATPGPWRVETNGGIDYTGEGWSTVEVSFDGGPDHFGSAKPGLVLGDHEAAEDDARFIAACSPDVITALLERLERAEQAIRRVTDLAAYLDGLAPGDRHYADRIRAALTPTTTGD